MRMLYEWIFGAVGPRPLAQLAAGVVIGALAGAGAVQHMPNAGGVNPLWVIVGCAGIGLFAGVILLGCDHLQRERPTGPRSPAAGIVSTVLTVLAVMGILVVITFVTLFLGTATRSR